MVPPVSGAVLVSGGAGYVGSSVAAALVQEGRRVVVLDDLSGGRPEAVPPGAAFVRADAGDRCAVAALVQTHGVSAALHLAGAPGVDGPDHAAWRDAAMSGAFAAACAAAGVRRLVLTSSAAVHGAGDGPVSAYGAAKLATEDAVRAAFSGAGRGHAVLRCFNVAGADAALSAGPGRGLVRVACEAALRPGGGVTLFGAGWDTADGTCVRDYVHVADVAAAHVAALRLLEGGCAGLTADIGTGRGHSVREVLAAVERVTAAAITAQSGPPRPGDVAVSVAAPERIAALSGWQPRRGGLETAVATTLAWLRAAPGGDHACRAGDTGACGARR